MQAFATKTASYLAVLALAGFGATSGCVVGEAPEHNLWAAAPGRPGTLGQTLGGGVDATADGADQTQGEEPDASGPPQVVIAELPFAGGHSFGVAADVAALSGSYGPYYVAFDVGGAQEVVRAALPGTVLVVNDSNTEGGPTPELIGNTNTVVIEHAGGVRTEYLHIRTLSGKVSPGEKVGVGQALAVGGGTGYVGGQRIGLRATRGGVPAPICFNTGEPVCDVAKPGDVFESVNYTP